VCFTPITDDGLAAGDQQRNDADADEAGAAEDEYGHCRFSPLPRTVSALGAKIGRTGGGGKRRGGRQIRYGGRNQAARLERMIFADIRLGSLLIDRIMLCLGRMNYRSIGYVAGRRLDRVLGALAISRDAILVRPLIRLISARR
jgi:hypothetical protein